MRKRYNDEYEYDDVDEYEDEDEDEEDDKGEHSQKFSVTTPWRAQCSEINAHRGHILPTLYEKPCHFILFFILLIEFSNSTKSQYVFYDKMAARYLSVCHSITQLIKI